MSDVREEKIPQSSSTSRTPRERCERGEDPSEFFDLLNSRKAGTKESIKF
jgi:hypothetical protein